MASREKRKRTSRKRPKRYPGAKEPVPMTTAGKIKPLKAKRYRPKGEKK